jgi:hypothetical protein
VWGGGGGGGSVRETKGGGRYRVDIDRQNFFDFGNEVDAALENRQLMQGKSLDCVCVRVCVWGGGGGR